MLKISSEVKSKCLNVCKHVEVVERNKDGHFLLLLDRGSSVSVKNNQIEKIKNSPFQPGK